ncbi:TPA_asm: helix-turn-helix domain-containing protein [Salmonella enterica subsp. enterica serovar Mbandaka]|uniref:helix-turn-helix domain-containing protein n=1 Tax=Enterobacteriaceae TaxID=543 RepID=UPI0018116604|nr:helix-turn-helix transcriptional regulator [Klebsiella variicola]HAB5397342.1 helix-turn-helix domain-containing protein [Salmonella enterica subsp. enterica serovar Mbandaka]
MLPKRLKAARLSAGISQQQLGILAGIDEATASARMNQYERGVHPPDFALMIRVAEILDVPSAYFYAVEDDLAEEILEYQKRRKKQVPSKT